MEMSLAISDHGVVELLNSRGCNPRVLERLFVFVLAKKKD